MRNTVALPITPRAWRSSPMAAVDEPSLIVTVTWAPPAPPGWISWCTHQPKAARRRTRLSTTPTTILSQRRPPAGGGGTGSYWAASMEVAFMTVSVQPGLEHPRGRPLVDHPPPGAPLHAQLRETSVGGDRGEALIVGLDRDVEHVGQSPRLGGRGAGGGAHPPVQGQGQAHHDQLRSQVLHELGDSSPVGLGIVPALEHRVWGGDGGSRVAHGHADSAAAEVEAENAHAGRGAYAGRSGGRGPSP